MNRLRGFTLLEVQLALIVLALVLGLAYSGLYLASRGWHTVEHATLQNDALRSTDRLLRELLGTATPLHWHQPGQLAQLIFRGQSERLRLVSALPAHRGGGGLQLILLEHREQQLQLGYLPLSKALNPFAEAALQQAEWVPLIEAAGPLSLAYYGIRGDELQANWHDHWQEPHQLPQLVRIQLRSADRNWPELVLPVHSRATPGPAYLNLQAASDAS